MCNDDFKLLPHASSAKILRSEYLPHGTIVLSADLYDRAFDPEAVASKAKSDQENIERITKLMDNML